jgi:hypothetical protein
MTCPKCQSTEVDSSGTCLVCGFNANESIPLGSSKQGEQESGRFSGMIEMDYANPSEADSNEKPELPQWRQELSRRLREIKQKRDAGISDGTTESAAKAPPFPGATSIPKAESTREAAAKTSSASRPPRRSPRAAKPTQTPEDRGNQNRPTARELASTAVGTSH